MLDTAWYLVYTKPRQENVAKENLLRQDYHIYLPITKVSRRRQNTYQLITEPFFPRYLFINLNTVVDNWGPIRSTRGVAKLVRFGEEAPRVPVELIEYLKDEETQRLTKTSTVPQFRKGDRVTIMDSFFAGYEGIFEEKNSEQRVSVLLNIIGAINRIKLSPELIELT